MNTPFTILEISDLHICSRFFEEQKKEMEALSRFLKSSKIDFLVIAGDVIDKTPSNHDKKEDDSTLFEKAGVIINELMKECGITDSSRVITVPGNHDLCRDPAKETPEFLEERTRFFVDSIAEPTTDSITREAGKDFRDLYGYSFSPFSKWYGKYCDKKSYHWDKSLLGNDLATGIGVIQGYKVFEDYRVIFVCINTEWNNVGKAVTPYLIRHFIKSTFNEINDKYPGYTVISVMHRNPYDLAWSDQYIEDSAVRLLYYHTDIIISGHNHSQPFIPPHRMINRAQLLNLGSVSGHRDKIKIPHQAALMTIDSFYDTMELSNLDYDGDWVKTSAGTYNLNTKLTSYFKGVSEYFIKGFHSGSPIRCISKSRGESDISAAIRNYFRSEKDLKFLTDMKGDCPIERTTAVILPVSVDSTNEQILQKIEVYGAGEPTVLIIYGIISEDGVEGLTNAMEAKSCELHKTLINDVLTGRVVLQTALVEVHGEIQQITG